MYSGKRTGRRHPIEGCGEAKYPREIVVLQDLSRRCRKVPRILSYSSDLLRRFLAGETPNEFVRVKRDCLSWRREAKRCEANSVNLWPSRTSGKIMARGFPCAAACSSVAAWALPRLLT